MKPFLAISAAAVMVISLAACETATPYQPLNPSQKSQGGYSDQQIEANRFRVSFSGNSVTSRETVEKYLLFRSAELTLAQGDDWFETTDRQSDKTTEIVAAPSAWGCGYGPGWCGGYWGPRWRYYRHGAWASWGPWMHEPLELSETSEYSAMAEIVLGKGPKPANDPKAFDARDVLSHLATGIQRPKP